MTNKPAKIGHNGGFAGEQLRQYIAQLEGLHSEKKTIADHIKDVYTVAKGQGFDAKIIREVLKLRKMGASKRQEQEDLTHIYLHSLGMVPDFEEDK